LEKAKTNFHNYLVKAKDNAEIKVFLTTIESSRCREKLLRYFTFPPKLTSN